MTDSLNRLTQWPTGSKDDQQASNSHCKRHASNWNGQFKLTFRKELQRDVRRLASARPQGRIFDPVPHERDLNGEGVSCDCGLPSGLFCSRPKLIAGRTTTTPQICSLLSGHCFTLLNFSFVMRVSGPLTPIFVLPAEMPAPCHVRLGATTLKLCESFPVCRTRLSLPSVLRSTSVLAVAVRARRIPRVRNNEPIGAWDVSETLASGDEPFGLRGEALHCEHDAC